MVLFLALIVQTISLFLISTTVTLGPVFLPPRSSG
jgi:hypothetical protein